MSFEEDLSVLRSASADVPVRRMKVRHERRMGPSTSVVQMLRGDRASQSQVIALYDLSATKGARPVVTVEVDPLVTLDVPDGSVADVCGWPAVGRAVVIDIGGRRVESTYPCVSPVLRPMRFR